MEATIAVGPGDGIGPEVVGEAVKALDTISAKFGHKFRLNYFDIGGASIDKYGEPLTKEAIELCSRSDAILLGAVGGPKWDSVEASRYPNVGLLRLRKEFGLYANLRLVKVFPGMENCSPVKADKVRGVDLVVVRENTGGVYFGEPRGRWIDNGHRKAVDTMVYWDTEIERILRVGFELARGRSHKLVSVDKENVLETGKLWRSIAKELHTEYEDVELRHMYADACTMWLMRQPTEFDVVVMGNLFGDIISDEASVLAGSLGMEPSAQLAGLGKQGERQFGFYEPSHGSAPRHAGKDDTNPIATILCVALMLRYSFGLEEEAKAVEGAVAKALIANRTYDIMESGKTLVGTKAMGDLVSGGIAV